MQRQRERCRRERPPGAQLRRRETLQVFATRYPHKTSRKRIRRRARRRKEMFTAQKCRIPPFLNVMLLEHKQLWYRLRDFHYSPNLLAVLLKCLHNYRVRSTEGRRMSRSGADFIFGACEEGSDLQKSCVAPFPLQLFSLFLGKC